MKKNKTNNVEKAVDILMYTMSMVCFILLLFFDLSERNEHLVIVFFVVSGIDVLINSPWESLFNDHY